MRYTVSADTIEELLSSVAHLAGTATEAEGTPKATRTRAKKSEAPEPVVPGAAPAAADTATAFPGVAAAAPAASNVTAFPGAAATPTAGAPFVPGAAAAPQPSETFTKVKAHLEAMAATHGVANVYNWIKQVLGDKVDQSASPEHVRDAVLPTVDDATLASIYAQAGGK